MHQCQLGGVDDYADHTRKRPDAAEAVQTPRGLLQLRVRQQLRGSHPSVHSIPQETIACGLKRLCRRGNFSNKEAPSSAALPALEHLQESAPCPSLSYKSANTSLSSSPLKQESATTERGPLDRSAADPSAQRGAASCRAQYKFQSKQRL